MDEEMSKLVAVKIIEAYTNEEAVLKSILLLSLDNNSTLLLILDNILRWKLEIVSGLYSCPCFLCLFNGQAPSQVGF